MALSEAAPDENIRRNYRTHIQRALRDIREEGRGFVYSDIISLQDLKGLRKVSLKAIGRVALPLCVEQQGNKAFDLFCACALAFSS